MPSQTESSLSNGGQPEVAPQIGSKDKSVGWYDTTLQGVPEDARELLEGYSQVPREQIDSYVLEMRDKAWDVFPYPCIGQFRFLQLSLYKQPSYPAMIQQLRQGAKYLDIGCCLGQDLRKLVADGVPSENLYGAELLGDFIQLGYDLFRDKDTLKTQFMQADVLDPNSPLQSLKGAIDFIHLGMILHVFSWEEQREVLETCIRILKPRAGTLIVGQAVGHAEGMSSPGGHAGGYSFKHSDESFRRLWKEISERTGIQFDCRAALDEGLGVADGKRKWDVAAARRLTFEVERVS
ncbi:hypothetical protein VM1G_01245 [Cytospora mali]|uniref:Methyltransferase domain-containing protein n=1 Tax=Cytospora mali TaxID=578113 RepID=A0A194VLS9_CYTMA|nr:hypothetical protein VM1G_01245 [Valsa mali]